MKTYNSRPIIKDYSDDAGILDVTDEMLDKLDAMLTAYGIDTLYAKVALSYDEDDDRILKSMQSKIDKIAE